MLKQLGAVTALNLRGMTRRIGSSAVTIASIAGVVVVLVGILSMAHGLVRTMTTGGDPLTAIVLRDGATAESASMLGLDTVRLIKDTPGIARRDGRPLASAEFVVAVRYPRADTGKPLNISLRGVEPEAFSIRDEVRVVDGRSFRRAEHEVIIGRAAARRLGIAAPGRSVKWGSRTWQIVGIFEAGGGSVESEVWCDIDLLQQAFRRQNAFQVVYAKLDSPAGLDTLRAALKRDPRLEVDIRRESDHYAAQARPLTNLITIAGLFIAILMGAGATFSAVNTMYAAVASRTREIATLRAIGFGRLAILGSVFVEATALALAGGALGALTAWALFDGYAVSTLNFQSMSQIAFAFAVTPALLVEGMLVAAALGLAGASWPAWRAARLPIAAALRES